MVLNERGDQMKRKQNQMKLFPYEEIKKNNTSNIHTIGDSKILLLTNQKGGL